MADMEEFQVTALLTDEAIIEAARSHAQEETKLMPDSTERDEHLEYAERDFEAGARFSRDRYEAAMQRERIKGQIAVLEEMQAHMSAVYAGTYCNTEAAWMGEKIAKLRKELA